MQIFNLIYQKVLNWATHKYAIVYLALLSIAESSFFPIPVDVMLVPMVLAQPKKWWHFALLTTIMSVIGGIIGYFIGLYFFDFISPILHQYHYWDQFTKIQSWFKEWGIWIVLVLGFSPVPYKIATIAAGVSVMTFLPFVLISIIGRGLRFFLVAFVVKLSAHKINTLNAQWIEKIGWFTVILLIIFIGAQWLS